MSIYISGVEVPKEGTVIVIDSTGQVWSNEWPTRGYTRIDGAKAVSVPEHGPLVDALEVINAFPDGFIFTNEQARALTNYIIPADHIGDANEMVADKEVEG